MIVLKIILAVGLTAIPFIIQPQKDKVPKWQNSFSLMADCILGLKNFFRKFLYVLQKLHDGMKRSRLYRKFYTLIILIVMIGYVYVDASAAQCAEKIAGDIVKESAEHGAVLAADLIAVKTYMTSPVTLGLSFILAMSFFSYRHADRLLLKVHFSRYGFKTLAILAILTAWHFFILAEIIFIILIAAFFYPQKEFESQPKGRKPLPKLLARKKTSKTAA